MNPTPLLVLLLSFVSTQAKADCGDLVTSPVDGAEDVPPDVKALYWKAGTCRVFLIDISTKDGKPVDHGTSDAMSVAMFDLPSDTWI